MTKDRLSYQKTAMSNDQTDVNEFMAAIEDYTNSSTQECIQTRPKPTVLVITLAAMLTMVGVSMPFVVSALNNRIPWVPTTTEKSTVLFTHLARLWIETGGIWPEQQHLTRQVCTLTKINAASTTAPKQPTLKFVDMGSGDGRVVLAAAHYGQKRRSLESDTPPPFLFGECVGIERNITLWAWSILTARCWHFFTPSRVTFLKNDFRHVDLSDTDVVMVFGVPAWMTKFGEKFERELRPGSMVATNKFPIPGWHPLVTNTEIFIYRIGLHRLNEHKN
ncbi:hypothetical protein O5D80_002686 [Batrachochytrium dendrobatidis]|nr:hypothetical protein O5D80_002686 [Batrachochytrium dendrobatidis]